MLIWCVVCRVILNELLVILLFFSLEAMEKAIVNFDVGTNPNNDGEAIRFPSDDI